MNALKFRTVILLLICTQIGRAADPLDTWTWRNPLPTGNGFNAITFGSGQFVAVGNVGTIATSTDGVSWVLRESGVQNDLTDLTYGNSLFVAVGYSGTILTSPDALNWTQQQAGGLGGSSVTYGNGLFVAVGGATILTSPDGVNWVQRKLGPTSVGAFHGVAYGNGRFVAVGGWWNSSTDYGGTIVTSNDGVNWAQPPQVFPQDPLGSIAFGNGQFAVAFSVLSTPKATVIKTSPDGVTWASRTHGPLYYVSYANGQFVFSSVDGQPVTSTDALNWTVHKTTIKQELGKVAYGNGKYVAVRGFGSPILTSTDVVNWVVQQESVTWNWLSAVTYGNGRFVAVGEDNQALTGTVLVSMDGVTWLKSRPSSGPFGGFTVSYGGGQFVLLSRLPDRDRSLLYTSNDGMNWVGGEVDRTSRLAAVTYGQAQFVAVGSSCGAQNCAATILSSTDGVNWVARQREELSASQSTSLSSVTFGNGRFVAVGDVYYPRRGVGGVAFRTSADGVNWVGGVLEATNSVHAIAYGNGQFVAVGHSSGTNGIVGTILSSVDGLNWVQRQPGENVRILYGITYGNGYFVAVGEAEDKGGTSSGTILTSTDGITWRRRQMKTVSLMGVGYGNGRVVAVGPGGNILESGSIIGLTITPNPASRLLSLSLEGPTGLDYTIQTSGDLISWRDVTKISNTRSSKVILDGLPAASDRQFYRVTSQ